MILAENTLSEHFDSTSLVLLSDDNGKLFTACNGDAWTTQMHSCFNVPFEMIIVRVHHSRGELPEQYKRIIADLCYCDCDCDGRLKPIGQAMHGYRR
jgi:hypothetical protein